MNLIPIELLTAIPVLAADVAALDLKKPDIYPAFTGRWWVAGAVMLAGIILLWNTWEAANQEPATDPEKVELKRRLAGLLAIWTLAPPLWFAFEYLFLYKPQGLAGSWETFKHGQEMWAKLWAGVVALLGLRLFAIKDAETKEEKKRKDGEKTRLDDVEKQIQDLQARLPRSADPAISKA